MSVYHTYIMTLQVWSNHSETTIISTTWGNTTWMKIVDLLHEPAVATVITQEEADKIIEKEKLRQWSSV